MESKRFQKILEKKAKEKKKTGGGGASGGKVLPKSTT
jgi:hypothetical protein